MIYKYPLKASETYTYSHKIKDYRRLSLADKKILVNNFKEFYKYVFWHQNLPHPTRDQLFLAKYMLKAVRSREAFIVQAQRGLAKSLTNQILVSWLLLRNRNEKIVVVSATSRRAKSFVKFVLSMLKTIPLLQHLYPQGDDRKSTEQFDVNGRIPDDSPSMIAFGVTSAKTGSRASFIIYDDVEIPENSDTPDKRQKILDGVRDTSNLGIAGVFREAVLCTPQSSDTVYDKLKNEDGFKRIIVPAEYPEDISVYDGDLARHITWLTDRNKKLVGTATDKRCDMSHLLLQKIKGKARYKLQYMLDTTMTDAEKYPLKLSDLIVMDLDEKKYPVHIEYSTDKKDTLYDLKHYGLRGDFIRKPRYISDDRADYDGIAMFIDPSGRGTDETTYCITAHGGGKIFVLDFGGTQGGYEISTLEFLANKAKQFKVNLIQAESNFGDGAFSELLKPVMMRIYPCMIEDKRATKQKELRIIETLEPIMMTHRLIINKRSLERDFDSSEIYSLTYQMTHITSERDCLKHDDKIDVLEMGVGYWKETLARDEKQEIDRYYEEQAENEIKAFIEDMIDIDFSNNVMDSW